LTLPQAVGAWVAPLPKKAEKSFIIQFMYKPMQGRESFLLPRAVLSKAKGNQQDKVCISIDRLKQFFPKGYTPKQIEKSILKILEAWKEQQKSIKEIPY